MQAYKNSFRLWLSLWVCIAALLGTVIQAQEEGGWFTVANGSEPAVKHGPTREWDGLYTDPGAVMYHDGKFHMFRNGFKAWPASVEIGYLTSDDGLNWTEVTEEPVLWTKDVPYAEVAALASSVIVEDDGTWVLYLYIWNSTSGRAKPGWIARATAKDPLGPWTPDTEPILLEGGAGEWDELGLTGPQVIKTDEGYVMYYTGTSAGNRPIDAIGMATSEDGITWTKYDDPATTEAPYAESDPIMVADAEWENGSIQHPRALLTPDGYVMIYRAVGGPRQNSISMRLGVASSEDGVTWTKYANNPIVKPNDVPSGYSIWYTAAAYHDGTYYLYLESDSGGGTNIFSTSYTGSLPPQ